MLVSVIKAAYIEEYKVKLDFDNGESGIVDLKEAIFKDHREVFESLRNMEFFKSFQLDSWTINWSNNVDFAPEFLYELAVKQNLKAHNIVS